MADTSAPKIIEEITHARTGPFAVNYYSDDFVAGGLAAELIAAPSRTNSATYLTHISMGMVMNAAGWTYDCNIKLIDGAGVTVFGPVQFETSGQTTFSKDFTKPLKVTDNKALDIQGISRSGYEPACWVYAEYYTGDEPIT